MVLSDLSDSRVPQSFAPSPALILITALDGSLEGFPCPPVVPSTDRSSAGPHRVPFERLLER